MNNTIIRLMSGWKLLKSKINDKSEKDNEYQKVLSRVIEDMEKYSGDLEIPRI
jgi:phage shock protein A